MIVLSWEHVAKKSYLGETLIALIDFWWAIVVLIADFISTFCSTSKHMDHSLIVKSSDTVAIILFWVSITKLKISALCPL